uniref:NADPH:adrenodoxin oxidoreductase, mitochondrial n=1 Tax=Arcella intermedia TaxID=1963864 RepID=A0A6B2L3K5_9EUKA
MHSVSVPKVCIVGAGPAGYYTADSLLRLRPNIKIDFLERLPSPFGLVRSGVAPDHPEVKLVENRFSEISIDRRVRFFGNVEVGRELSVIDLQDLYHVVVFAVGSMEDTKLGIPGEELRGVHSARDFVEWYNCYPDRKEEIFQFSGDSAVVVGNGNVAVDVARILLRNPEDLYPTDINMETIKALRNSNIKNVHVIGRRGPVQSAFTTKELRELTKLSGIQVVIDGGQLQLTESCIKERDSNRVIKRKMQLLEEIQKEQQKPSIQQKVIHLHFLKSPVSFKSNGSELESVVLRHNKLVGPPGKQKAVPTEALQEIKTNLVFRSIGYRSVPIEGLPFNYEQGIIPNEMGHVIFPNSPNNCFFVSGWVKGGASGTIGSTLLDAEETAQTIHSFMGSKLDILKEKEDVENLFKKHQMSWVNWNDWKILDTMELQKGKELGRLRTKFSSIQGMIDALRTVKS